MSRIAALLGLTLAAGCFAGEEHLLPDDFSVCDEGGAQSATAPLPDLPTYYRDAKVVIDARCTGCHDAGGIGPFPLTDYESVFGARDALRQAVITRVMPPWQPDDCCREYRWDRSLEPDEIDLLVRWVETGAAEGDPADEPEPRPRDERRLPRVDATLTMPEPFEPRPVVGADEVRCFVLDWPFDRDVYVTGFEAVPGAREVVHHMSVVAIDRDDVERLRGLEAEDDRPGWDCYGGLDEVRGQGFVGGWTPGMLAVELPDGLGRFIPAGSAIMLNMHYDTGRGTRPDQTSLRVMVEDEVERRAEQHGVGNPQWVVGDGLAIGAGDPDAWHYFAYDPTDIVERGRSMRIHAVNVHMHELGSIGRLAILRRDGTTDCLLNIDDFDFHWLSDYWLAEPAELHPGDRLYVECHWDNTAGNQKVVNGEQQVPRDIGWGTDQEMCGGILTVSYEDDP